MREQKCVRCGKPEIYDGRHAPHIAGTCKSLGGKKRHHAFIPKGDP